MLPRLATQWRLNFASIPENAPAEQNAVALTEQMHGADAVTLDPLERRLVEKRSACSAAPTPFPKEASQAFAVATPTHE
jgi:hypothetical protein